MFTEMLYHSFLILPVSSILNQDIIFPAIFLQACHMKFVLKYKFNISFLHTNNPYAFVVNARISWQ